MSQQINLLLPELRPRWDWLAFPVVAGVALAGIAVMAGLASWGGYQANALKTQQAQSEMELKALQQDVQSLGQTLAGRKPNAALQAEIEQLKEVLQQRDAAFAVVEAGKVAPGGGHASLLRGFARQAMEGVWLTGFSFSGQDAEIRGRLTQPALLPQYIRRLNGEQAFQGRRFAALDMKDGAAATAPAATAPAPTAVPVPRYTEFVLHGNLVAASEGKKP